MRNAYHGTPPNLGKTDGTFPGFSFLRAREICVRILPLLSGAPTIDIRNNKGPTPFSREAIEGSGNIYV